MKNIFKINSAAAAAILSLLLILICSAAAVIFDGSNTVNFSYDDDITDLNYGWADASGDDVSADSLPAGDAVITRSLGSIELDRKRLCFGCVDTHVTVYFDGKETYRFAPEYARIFGKSYGRYIQMIPIPSDAKTVTLELHPIYEGTSPVLTSLSVQDAGQFLGSVYHNGLPGFTLCMIIFLFGVLMVIIGFSTFHTVQGERVDFFSLGAFAILAGLWSANDTMIIQVFTQHPETVKLINYLCLIFIAYLPVSFMASTTRQRNSPLLPVLMGLILLNFTLTLTLSLLGIADVRQMLTFSHINIAIALAMTVYLMITAARKKTVPVQYLHTVTVGMTAAVLGVAADMVRYLLFPNLPLSASFFSRIGILTFLILMGLHLMTERTRIAVEQGQSELMKKMAYTDGLTSLSNRTAFHEKEDDLRQDKSECVIVQLDINFLKRVNDEYGHAEGDRHIVAAARIISESFESLGSCYRVGGDEFIAVVQKGGSEEVERALAAMEQLISEYNSAHEPPVPLQIAYGWAHYRPQEGMLEAAERLADRRMYEKKKEMKSRGRL